MEDQLLYELSQRRIHELEILRQIDRELYRNLDLDTVLDTLIRLAARHMHADEAAVFFYNPHIQAIQAVAAIGRNAEKRKKQPLPLNHTKGIIRWVLQNKETVRVDNVLTDPHWSEMYIQRVVETLSELDVPLLDGEEVLGVLNVESTREKAFSREDELFLVTLAGQALLAIKNAQAYGQEKRLAEERLVLNEISKEITSQLDCTQVFDLILDKALSLTKSATGSLHLYDPVRRDLRLETGRGQTMKHRKLRQTLDQGIIGYVAKTKQWYSVGDVTVPPWNRRYQELFTGTRSELAVPMLAGNELRGVLNLESPHAHNFTAGDIHLLCGLADLAVVALQNAEQYQHARLDALRFDLLYQAGQQLGRITNLEQVQEAYNIIIQIALQKCQSLIVLCCSDAESQEFKVVAASPPDSHAVQQPATLSSALCKRLEQERRTLALADLQAPTAGDIKIEAHDPLARSLLLAPVAFKERYYGYLELDSTESGHFPGGDARFFEGLAQQLASTLHRLEITHERQELEQRAQSAEIMIAIGQATYEITHRVVNDLGLVGFYINHIRETLQLLHVNSPIIGEKLECVEQAVNKVMDHSEHLRTELNTWRENGGFVLLPPRILLEEALQAVPMPDTINVSLEVSDDVAPVRVIHSLIVDTLRNLVTNAREAMPNGGQLVLRARNKGRSVALEVIDTGCGIPLEHQDHIFNLLFSTKEHGSGFGLWSAQRNALKNRGKLEVRSEPNKGATFLLLLPRTEEGSA